MVEPIVCDCSDVAARILLEGAQEILGIDKLRSLLEEYSSESVQTIAALKTGSVLLSIGEVAMLAQILEGNYGVQGGRGLSLRIGRSAFKYGLKHFSEESALNSVSFRLFPAPRRLEIGLQTMARILSHECSDVITVADAGDYWLWRSENCLSCRNHQSADSSCYLTVGLLQEYMAWAGGGRFYRVTEIECRAAGDQACVYQITKTPLD
jgi:hypothetical protein